MTAGKGGFEIKKRVIVLALALCLGLSGCAAMLERSYEVSSPHVDKPATAEDDSYVRVENYRELVSAVLYLVSGREEEGVIRLYDYKGDVEADLTGACLEVATEDPLGAYCVDYIKHESVRVVSYDQATLSIHYRRSAEQVGSMVKVTGTSAIRTELKEALAGFENEVVLRVASFAEDEQSIRSLVRQAYYDMPLCAQGFPQVEVALYPDSGRERIVEILLTYGRPAEELAGRSQDAAAAARDLVQPLQGLPARQTALRLAQILGETARYDPQGENTSYAALVDGAADSEGMALAYAVLCGQADLSFRTGLNCEVVEGTLPAGGEDPPQADPAGEEPSPGAPAEDAAAPRFWNVLRFPGEEPLYLDPSDEAPRLMTAEEMAEAGYTWPGGPAEEAEPAAEALNDGLSVETDAAPAGNRPPNGEKT